jgi:restriction system protein
LDQTVPKSYYRVRLGEGGKNAEECLEDGFVGTDFRVREDLSSKLPENWRDFNREFIPVIVEAHPGKSRVGAGLNSAALWTLSKGVLTGDVVISPDAVGRFHVGEVTGPYFFQESGVLPHRRPVAWSSQIIDRADMPESLWRAIKGPLTVVNVTGYAEQIEALLGGFSAPVLVSTDESVEDPSSFAMEKHLEDFLVENWSQTSLGAHFDILEDEGALVGQQYPTDTGPIDILAVSKDKTRLLVIELKKGRANDRVVGQTLRYMGYVGEELAEEGQTVEGAIIAPDGDLGLRRALSLLPNVAFYRYEVNFRLTSTDLASATHRP